MKNLLFASGLILLTGCSSMSWSDRGSDLGDVFTGTAGIGGGVTARVGALHAGLGCMHDVAGLRGGNAAVLQDPDNADAIYEMTFWNKEQFMYGRVSGKNIRTVQTPWIPMVNITKNGTDAEDPQALFNPYYTQIECAVAFFPGFRMGFNLGELADFFCGFAGYDMFKDDNTTIENFRAEQRIKNAESFFGEEEEKNALILQETKSEEKRKDEIADQVKKDSKEGQDAERIFNTNLQDE